MSKLPANFSRSGYPFGRLTWNVQVTAEVPRKVLLTHHRLMNVAVPQMSLLEDKFYVPESWLLIVLVVFFTFTLPWVIVVTALEACH